MFVIVFLLDVVVAIVILTTVVVDAVTLLAFPLCLWLERKCFFSRIELGAWKSKFPIPLGEPASRIWCLPNPNLANIDFPRILGGFRVDTWRTEGNMVCEGRRSVRRGRSVRLEGVN